MNPTGEYLCARKGEIWLIIHHDLINSVLPRLILLLEIWLLRVRIRVSPETEPIQRLVEDWKTTWTSRTYTSVSANRTKPQRWDERVCSATERKWQS